MACDMAEARAARADWSCGHGGVVGTEL